jgi:hypothetical protein
LALTGPYNFLILYRRLTPAAIQVESLRDYVFNLFLSLPKILCTIFSFPFAHLPFQFRAMSRDYVIEPFHSEINLQIDYARELNPQQLAAVTAPLALKAGKE